MFKEKSLKLTETQKLINDPTEAFLIFSFVRFGSWHEIIYPVAADPTRQKTAAFVFHNELLFWAFPQSATPLSSLW